MFTEIMALVHDRSSEKRTVLFRMISDLFTEDADVHSNRELLLFGDVLGRLLDQVAVDERAQFSGKVARLAATPRELALRLADDEHIVAAPVLEHSPVLTEDDLVDLASRKSNLHRIAIARRPELGEAVTDVLVDLGNDDVHSTVSSNKGARFSYRSITILTERATTSQRLAEALATRSDLPPGVAEGLLKVIGPVARARMEQLIKSNESGLGKLIVETNREVNDARGALKRNRTEAVAMAEAVRLGRRSVDAVIDALLDQKRVLDVSYVFADLCGVPESHVNAVMFKIDSQPIAILSRVAGISDQTYLRLTRLRCDKLNLAESQQGFMLSVFRNLDAADADKALDFHRKRRMPGERRAG